MPNDCWNLITLKATSDQIQRIRTEAFLNVPAWAHEILQVGRGALIFRLWSRNVPAEEFMATLFDKYVDIWIKNEWISEGGSAGVIVGTADSVSRLDWNEGCNEEWDHRLRDEQEGSLHT